MARKYQKKFPNYKLKKEEVDWISIFEGMAGFFPIGTEEVFCQKEFLEMINKNEEHCLSAADEAVAASGRAKCCLSYYPK